MKIRKGNGPRRWIDEVENQNCNDCGQEIGATVDESLIEVG